MTGLQYLRRVSSMINSKNPSETWMDKKTTFDLIYQAACEFVRRSACLRSSQNILTITPANITAVSAANPCQITAASHGMSTGDQVYLQDIGGATELNNRRYGITKVGASTYTLDGVDSSFFTAYTSGGVSYPVSYTLNYDFLGLYQINPETGSPVIYFYQDSDRYTVDQKDYDELIYKDLDTAGIYPTYFSIIPSSFPSVVSSTTTSAGAQAGGESTLTNTSGAFLTTNVAVKPGDEVINKTSGCQGVVLAVTDASNLKTAIFDDSQPVSSYASWGSGDSYMIVPRKRYQIILSNPLSSGGDTIIVPYLQIPTPVYSDYSFYSLPGQGEEAVMNYAAWLYAYRDKEPGYGDRFYNNWDRIVRDTLRGFDRATRKTIKKPQYYV